MIDEAITPIVRTFTDAPVQPDDLDLASYPRNDIGNARRLIERHGHDIIWVHEVGWHIWDGKRFASEGAEGTVIKRAHMTAAAINDEVAAMAAQLKEAVKVGEIGKDEIQEAAKRIDDLRKFASQSGNSVRIKGMIEMAKPYLTVMPRDVDAQAFVMNLPNGTLILPNDVVVGDDGRRRLVDGDPQLLPHSRADLHTRLANVAYDADAECPAWLAFLDRIMPDKSQQLFLQTWLGYSLTADCTEQQMAVFHGKGANGKSTLVELSCWMWGDYACVTSPQTFMHDDHKRGGEASPDIARLMGKRFVAGSELDPGQRLSESTVKQITGGEDIPARKMFKDFFEFKPVFKLALSANVKPSVRGQDEGIWRRILLVPFEVFIPPAERDKALGTKLRAEASGILNWIIDGYRVWRERGLMYSESIKRATDEYRTESDPIGEFMRTNTRREAGSAVQAGRLYAVYVKWSKAWGNEPRSITSFGRRLGDLGYHKEKTGIVVYADLAIIQEDFPGVDSSNDNSPDPADYDKRYQGDPGNLPDQTA